VSKKLRPDETQESVEEWADMIAQMQDSGKNPKWRKKGTKLEQTTNKTRQRPTGWQIRIATDTQKIVINCRYSSKRRGKDGRIRSI